MAQRSPRGEAYFSNLKQDETFAEWFWQGTNGNELIEFLNRKRPSGDSDRLRREASAPFIYGIVVNHAIKTSPNMKLVKIGFTQKETTQGEGNRMEQVKKQIVDKLNSDQTIKQSLERTGQKVQDLVEVLFVIPIRAVDTRDFYTIEDWVRTKVGVKAPKDKAKALGLPVATEWIVAKQDDLSNLRTKIARMKERKEEITTEVFKNVNKTLTEVDIPATWP